MVKPVTSPVPTHQKSLITFLIGLGVVLALGMVLALGGCNIYPDEKPANLSVYRGKMSDLILCEGDDGEIFIVGSKIRVECADRRRVPVKFTSASIGNMLLDCAKWCAHLLQVHGEGPSSVKNIMLLP